MDQDSKEGTPRRRRWRRVIGVVAGLFLLGFLSLIIAWVVWDVRAADRHAAALAALEEEGVATTREQFIAALPTVSPEANAAVPLNEAADAIDTESEVWRAFETGEVTLDAEAYEQSKNIPFLLVEQMQFDEATGEYRSPDGQPAMSLATLHWDMTPAEEWAVVRAVLEAERDALQAVQAVDDRIRPAVAEVQADFGAWQNTPPLMLEIDLSHMSEQRALAELQGAAVLEATLAGRHDEIAPHVVRMLGQSDAMAADSRMIVPLLVSAGIDSLAAQRVMQIAPHVRFGGDAGMSVARARQLIDLLLDDIGNVAALHQSLAGEATMHVNRMQHLQTGESGRRPRSFLRPFLNENAALDAETMVRAVQIPPTANYPEYRRQLPVLDDRVLDSRRYMLAAAFTPNLFRATQVPYRATTDRHLAAVSLAIAMYRAEHGGALPPSLEALVPAYLPRVPIDPMAEDGDIRYDADRAIVWSVGEDATDDGGDATLLRRRDDDPIDPIGDRWTMRDAVVPLTREGQALRSE